MGERSVEVFNPDDLKHMMQHLDLKPGDECPGCHRPLPKVKSDEQTGPRRSVVSIHEPADYAGTLEPMMIAVVDKYKEQWPLDYAAMRQGIGIEAVGGRCWKFHVVHFALYATLMVPGLSPTE